jgi:hypothetical protein
MRRDEQENKETKKQQKTNTKLAKRQGVDAHELPLSEQPAQHTQRHRWKMFAVTTRRWGCP